MLTRPGQYEEMKKIKDDLQEELQRERSAHRHYKRECAALKEEYNNLRLRVYLKCMYMYMYVACSPLPLFTDPYLL